MVLTTIVTMVYGPHIVEVLCLLHLFEMTFRVREGHVEDAIARWRIGMFGTIW